MCVERHIPRKLLISIAFLSTAPTTAGAASLTVWLQRADDRQVHAGRPFEIEVRGTFDAPLAAVDFHLTATGDVQAALVKRSANPLQRSGLAFISETQQVPFEDGLPHEFGASGSTREVLLTITAPPFDALYPGEGVLIERITVVPRGTGTLTISLTAGQAATTRDDADGTLFDDFNVDTERATITVFVHVGCDYDGDIDADLMDVQAFQQCFSGEGVQAIEPCTAVFDDDTDGDLDLGDAEVLIGAITGPQLPGTIAPQMALPPALVGTTVAGVINPDVDGNGVVNERDLVFVRARLGTTDEQADANGDTVVNLLDLVAVRNRLDEGGTLPERERLRITEIWPWESETEPAWVELKYDARSGESSYLTAFELLSRSNTKYSNGFSSSPLQAEPGFRGGGPSYYLKTYPLQAEPGHTILVRFDGGAGPPEYLGDGPPYDGVLIHKSKPYSTLPMFDPLSDECLLRYREVRPSIIVDRVEWGDVPERYDALNTVVEPIPDGGSIGRDPIETDTWRRFPTPTPGEDNGLPPPAPYFPYPTTELASDQAMRFVWLDYRHVAMQYQLQIAEDEVFTSPQVDVTVDGTVHDLAAPLAPGDYCWRVRTEYRSMEGTWSSATPFTVLSTGTQPLVPNGESGQSGQGERSTDVSGPVSDYRIPYFASLGIEAPRKDTHKLCLECRQDLGNHAWDMPHPPSNCEHARYYHLQAIAATINHYYGGSIKQDEISDWIAYRGPEGSLGHADPTLQTPLNAKKALEYTLRATITGFADFSSGPVRSVIMADTPILGFLQVLALPGAGARPILIFGHDNTGGLDRVIFYDPVVGSIPYSVPTTMIGANYYAGSDPFPHQMNDETVDDTDGDGIVDGDEQNRFDTEMNDPDTDHDGINDKNEFWSYLFGQGRIPRIADIDGDGVRTEKDSDSDGDGCHDGLEDANRDGMFGFYFSDFGGFMYQMDETDPFYEEEYEITVSPVRPPAKLAFKECGDLKVRIKDSFGNQLKDKIITLTVDPTLASFGPPQGGQPIDTARVVTQDENWVEQRICALEKRGTARIEASWTRCQDSPEPVTAELNVTIVPYDWIFAVQEEAALTGELITEDYHIHAWSTDPPQIWGQRGSHSHGKDGRYQTLRGHFEYPGATDVGKWIDSISLVFSPGADTSHATLNIDDVPIVDGHTWTRTSEDQSPQKWEIWYIDNPGGFLSGLPRYISVRSGGSLKERRAPLLWWRYCNAIATRERTIWHWATSDRWVVLAYDGKASASAAFFFGDGDSLGYDRGFVDWENGENSTLVGFIPVGTVNGLPIRHNEHASFSLSWWMEGEPSGGTAFHYDIFRWRKAECAVGPPFGWTVTEYAADSAPTVDELREELSGAPALPTLLNNITFKRDYIGNDADELRIRDLEAPLYTVLMKNSP